VDTKEEFMVMEQTATFPMSNESAAMLDNLKADLPRNRMSPMVHKTMNKFSWKWASAVVAIVAAGGAFYWYRKS
jgi:hypothetical protein